jgi:methylated-DNA-[protein]-cysteine S-methyltransferase
VTGEGAPPAGPAFHIFDTAIGRCALVWRGEALIGSALPGPSLAESLARRFPGAAAADPPAFVRAAIDRVAALFVGDRVDFADIPLDLGDAAPFERAVYAAACAIPAGEVRTYGELAAAIGAPGAARAVGRALGRNPLPIVIPCHRILAAAGKSGGFSAPGGAATKFRLLALERARRPGSPELFESLPLAVRPGA